MKSLVEPINGSILPCLLNVTLLSKSLQSLTLILLKGGGKYRTVTKNVHERQSGMVKSEKRLGFGIEQSLGQILMTRAIHIYWMCYSHLCELVCETGAVMSLLPHSLVTGKSH